MDLWNEYEGRSIDGLFPLERLIRPEGRSAFFTTSSAGTSTVIRLIESHFDEEEILARWAGVSDLHQPNLLTLTRFGQAMMDETSLVYVVLEPTEADLSQILCERPLTPAETRQIASSLLPALQALHAKGFIHEHIQPVNVLAVGEIVKLRSDCIREAPEGAEGTALRARDVQDFATLLLQCLTQQRGHAVGPTGPPLPAPFREIIQNGISGTWSLDRMAASLEAENPQPVRPEPARSEAAETLTVQELHRRPAIAPQQVTALPTTAPQLLPERPSTRIRVPMQQPSGISRRGLLLSSLAVLALIVFAAYAVMHRSSSGPAVTTTPSVTPGLAEKPPVPPLPESANVPAAPVLANQPTASSARKDWRVVAFTYNRQDQAAAKAHLLSQRYASLHPAVFSPTGRAPYLVTLGGALSRDAAFSLKSKLRGAGLPRDIYAQNYSAKSR